MKNNFSTSLFLFIIFLTIGTIHASAQSAGDFRTSGTGTGNWKDTSTWRTFNGTDWVKADAAPTSASGVITIRNGHTVTANTNQSGDQIVVETGATFTISGGTFTLANGNDDDLIVNGTFSLSGTTNLAGAGTVLINLTMNWTGGALSRPLAVASGSTINISGTANKNLNAALVNDGTMNWSGGKIICNGSSTSMTNNNIFIVTGDNSLENVTGGTGDPPLYNNGTFTKTTGTGITTIDVLWYNSGTIYLETGTINSIYSFTNSGPINFTAGTTFQNSGTLKYNAGSQFNGTGTFNQLSTLSLGVSLNMPSSIVYSQSGPNINGVGDLTVNQNFTLNPTSANGGISGTGALIINGDVNWTTGTLGRSLSVANGNTINISTSSKTLNASLTNNGNMTWSAGTITLGSSGALINNGIFTATGDNRLDDASGSPYFSNTGTFIKTTGTGTTEIELLWYNTGTINIETGTLKSNRTFDNQGTINFTAGTTFLNNSTFKYNAASQFNGTGTFSQLSTLALGVSLNMPSSIVFSESGPNINGAGDLTINQNFTLNPSTANGGISGTGALTINGDVSWTTGVLGRPLTIASGNTLTISGSNKNLNNALINNGTMTWSAGKITCNGNSTSITNNSIFTVTGDNTLEKVVGGSGSPNFVNNGTFSKTSTGTTTFDLSVNNTSTGTINGKGILAINQSFTSNGVISPGLSPGILTVNTAQPFSGNSKLNIELNDATGAGIGHDQLQRAGNMTLAGTLNVTVNPAVPIGDYVIINLTSGTRTGTFATVNIPDKTEIIYNSTSVVLRKKATFFRDLDEDGFGNPNSTILSHFQPAGYLTDNTDCNDNDALEHPGAAWFMDNDEDGYGDGTTVTQCTRPVHGYVTSELTSTTTDCNNSVATIHPGAAETCNGIDDDCDGQTDEGIAVTFFRDADGDTFGDAATTKDSCAAPVGYVSNSADCDDTNPAILGKTEYYIDADHDGYGSNAIEMLCSVIAPFGYSTNNLDCDDGHNTANPGEEEICNNGIDDNCNGLTDEGCVGANKYFADTDGDTFGDKNNFITSNVGLPPTGYVTDSTDCNDAIASIHPGALEILNSVDDDCNGFVDDECQLIDLVFIFNDLSILDPIREGIHSDFQLLKSFTSRLINKLNIGISETQVSIISYDANARVVLEMTADKTEIQNSIDNYFPISDTYPSRINNALELAKSTNSGRANAKKIVVLFTDDNLVFNGNLLDLDTIVTTANEIKNNNGTIFCVASETMHPGVSYTVFIDTASFKRFFCSFIASTEGGIQTIFPDLANDYVDFESNYLTKSQHTSIFYHDSDGDGFGNPSVTIKSCLTPLGYVNNDKDCNDNNPAIFPGAIEVLNSVDDDCNGIVDDICEQAAIELVFDATFWGNLLRDQKILAKKFVNSCNFNNGNTKIEIISYHGGYLETDGTWHEGSYQVNKFLTGDKEEILNSIDALEGSYGYGHPKIAEVFNSFNIRLNTFGSKGANKFLLFFNSYLDDDSLEIYSKANSLKSKGVKIFQIDSRVFLNTSHFLFSANKIASAVPNVQTIFPDPSLALFNLFPAYNSIAKHQLITYYRDNDGDGHGDPAFSVLDCLQPDGYSADDHDCNDANAAVVLAPSTPGTIEGAVGVCKSQTGVTFSVTPVTGSGTITYQWQLPSGATGSSTTNSITVSFSGYTGGNICVRATNGSCTSDYSCRPVLLNTVKPLPPGTISGSSWVCQGETYTYTIDNVLNASSYNWTIPSNCKLLSGQGTRQLTVSFNNNFTSGNINVNASNCIGTSGNKSLTVKAPVPASPSAISGSPIICTNGTRYTYTVTNIPDATGVIWIKPSNSIQVGNNVILTGTTSINQATITLEFTGSFTSGTLSVKSTNCNDTSSAKNLTVSKMPILGQPGAISGPSKVCPGTTQSYSVAPVANATSYTWTPPSKAHVIQQGNNTVEVAFDGDFTNTANLVVTASNCSGMSSTRSKLIGLDAPNTPGAISGPTQLCNTETGFFVQPTYSISAVSGASGYKWILEVYVNGVLHHSMPGSGTGTTLWYTFSTFDLPFNYTSMIVKVQAINACGGASAFQTLTVTPPTQSPSQPGTISGSAKVCPGTTVTYSVTPVAGASIYTWTPPSKAHVIQQGNNVVQVSFDSDFTNTANLVVTASNCSGTSSTRSLLIGLVPVPNVPGSISGTKSVCDGNYNYSISNVTNAASYIWSVHSSCTFNGSSNGTSVSINIPSNFAIGNVCVKSVNACGIESFGTRCLTLLNVPPDPSGINGPTSVCRNQAGVIFSVTAVSGVNYAWKVPAGAVITSGQTTKSITVTWGTQPATSSDPVTVMAYNVCGGQSVNTKTKNVSIKTSGCTLVREEEVQSFNETVPVLSVFPNPADDEATVLFSTLSKENYQLRVTDISGRIILQFEAMSVTGENEINFHVKDFSAGIYFVTLTSDTEGPRTIKFVKQ